MLKLPKILTLDLSKWRCGAGSRRKGCQLGKGLTRLLNKQGYMCCLGQFCEQAGVSRKELIKEGNPDDLKTKVSLLVQNGEDTRFSTDAIRINDNVSSTIEEKIKDLKTLCSIHKRKLSIVNGGPKDVLRASP